MHKVSVIVPTYNRPELLRKALLSIYAQTYTDFEVIVVDDGATLSARETLGDFFAHQNFRYLETEKNKGGSAARNMGIAHAKGEYIAFLDDDDEWFPKKLEIQCALLEKENKKVGFVFSAINTIYDDYVYTTPVDSKVRDYSAIARVRFNGFLTSSLVVRREVFEAIGVFDESLPSHQEADIILRIAQKYEGAGISEPLVTMRMSRTDDHIGASVDRRIAGREMLLKKHAPLLLSDPKVASRQYFWLAQQYRMKHDYKKSAYLSYLSCISNPNITSGVHMISSSFLTVVQGVRNFFFEKVCKPAHVGLLLRRMYFYRYMPRGIFAGTVSVLDAGCGRGRFSEVVAKQNPNAIITSVDLVPQKEWDIYPYKNISFKAQDLHTLAEVHVYDYIMSVDVLEHILDNKSIITRFATALKKGGYLYLAVPCDATSIHIFPKQWFAKFYAWDAIEHIGVQYTLPEWKVILENAGFVVETARYTFTFWGTLAWEVEFLLNEKSWGKKCNLILMPLYRLLALLDIYLSLGKGNNLIVAKKS